jgi:hypothetical protein
MIRIVQPPLHKRMLQIYFSPLGVPSVLLICIKEYRTAEAVKAIVREWLN